MNLEWSDDALADFDRFVEFLNKERPSLAAIVAGEIIAKAQVLTSFRGLVGRLPGARNIASSCFRSRAPLISSSIGLTVSIS